MFNKKLIFLIFVSFGMTSFLSATICSRVFDSLFGSPAPRSKVIKPRQTYRQTVYQLLELVFDAPQIKVLGSREKLKGLEKEIRITFYVAYKTATMMVYLQIDEDLPGGLGMAFKEQLRKIALVFIFNDFVKRGVVGHSDQSVVAECNEFLATKIAEYVVILINEDLKSGFPYDKEYRI